MAKDINVKITGDSRDLERALGKASKASSGFGRTLAKAATIGAAALATGLAVGAAKSVQAASDLEESMNAIRVVFGKATKSIVDFGRTSATSVGLSQRAFNQAVTPIGAALQNVGLGAQEAADQSINLTRRAADMASVFNTDVSEALVAIQAALRGEADPIERFGIGLSDAAVQAQAARMGMEKLDGQFTAGQKTRARLALFFQQSNKFAGDFANTSGSLANQQRILRSRFEDIAASIGNRLLPFLTDAAEKVSDLLDFFDKVGKQKTFKAKVEVVLEGVGDAARNFWSAVFDPQIVRRKIEVRPGRMMKIQTQDPSLASQFGEAFANAVAAIDWAAVGAEMRRGFTEVAKTVQPIAEEAIWGKTGKDVPKGGNEQFDQFITGVQTGWEKTGNAVNAAADKIDSAWAALTGGLEEDAQASSGTVSNAWTRAMARVREQGRRSLGDVRLQLGRLSDSGLKAKDRIEELGAAGRRAAPGIGAAARTAAALAEAWGRVVSLPSAKAFEVRFHSITTVETNRLQGRRATGGPVAGGSAYLVGERGPEVFVPNVAGRVVANGGMGPTVIVNVAGSVQTERDLARTISRELDRMGIRDGI